MLDTIGRVQCCACHAEGLECYLGVGKWHHGQRYRPLLSLLQRDTAAEPSHLARPATPCTRPLPARAGNPVEMRESA